MVRATYQSRLSAIILGIRPSVAHVYGSGATVPVDNLTHLGIEAWQVGLRQLHTDLFTAPQLTQGEQWMQTWVRSELDRETNRWADASSIFELLAISLGPAGPDPSIPRGRLFWNQWRRNLAHHVTLVSTGTSAASHDTLELCRHVAHLALEHDAPQAVLDDLRTLELAMGPVAVDAAPFRPLATAVERLQLSAILASAYDDEPACTAAMSRLLEQRAPSLPCHADTSRRHMVRGWRYGSAAPGR